MKKFLFNIDDENLKFLENLSTELNVPKSKILNKIISNFSQNRQNEIKDDKLDYDKEKNQKQDKEVRLFFTQNEYNIIKENATKNNHFFVKQEIKFLIFNSIYNDKFSNEFELKQFILTKTALNQIARNLNQLNRELIRRSIVKINEKNLEITLKNISDKLDNLIKNLDNLIKKSKDKIR